MREARASPADRLTGARIPNHLAMIPDGNRRWAQANGQSVTQGHRRGFDVARRLARFCRRIGIHTVTVWAFSTENWRRPPEEVAGLMRLYEEWIEDFMPEAIEEEVRVVHIGRLEGVPAVARADAAAAGFDEGIPPSLRRALVEIVEKTGSFHRNIVNLALNYGGVDEIKRATRRLLEHAKTMGTSPSELDVENFLDTAGQPHPNPDLVWRTSGEMRFSGFLPLQAAYAELVFTPKHFPDLNEDDVADAVLEYSRRARRFGG